MNPRSSIGGAMAVSWWGVPENLGVSVGLAALWVGAIGLTAELLHRYAHLASELSRKIVHIGTGNVVLLAWWLAIPAWVAVAAAMTMGGLAWASYHYPLLPGINGVGRRSFGTVFYAISIGLLVGIFWAIQRPEFAAIGILVMTWGDGFAALVGQKFGRHRYELWGIKKSWEGSLTMAIVSFAITSIILISVQGIILWIWPIALVTAMMATSLEAFSKYGIDNLTVPVGSAAIAFALSYWCL